MSGHSDVESFHGSSQSQVTAERVVFHQGLVRFNISGVSPTCASLLDSTSRRKRSILAYVGAYASSNSRNVRGVRVAGPDACGDGFPTDDALLLACAPGRLPLLPSCLVLDVLGLEAAEGAFGRVDCDSDMGDARVGFVGDRCKCETGGGVTGEFACRGLTFGEMCRDGWRESDLESTMPPGLAGELGSCSPGVKGSVSMESRWPIFARMNGVMPYTGSGDVEPAGVGK